VPTPTTSISISGSWLVEEFSLLSKFTEIKLPGLAVSTRPLLAVPLSHACTAEVTSTSTNSRASDSFKAMLPAISRPAGGALL
jgi:hypothetical protein